MVTRQGLDGKTNDAWPIYAEQAAVVGKQAWCWNEDGMLIGLSDKSSSESDD